MLQLVQNILTSLLTGQLCLCRLTLTGCCIGYSDTSKPNSKNIQLLQNIYGVTLPCQSYADQPVSISQEAC